MSDKLEELKKELVQEIQALASDLANTQSFVGLLSYESKFKSLHEKFINLKFLERKQIGLDIFDSPIPVEDEKHEIFSVSEERFEDEKIKEYHFENDPKDKTEIPSLSIEEESKEEVTAMEPAEHIVENEETFSQIDSEDENQDSEDETNTEHDSFTEIMSHDIDDFSDLLPKLELPQIQIDFNDRLAFLNQLFDGNTYQMESTIQTLNYIDNMSDSKDFINDLKQELNWTNKEEYIDRLMELVAKRFD